MKARCYRPTCNGYEHYGGRGIKVCDEWMSKPNDPMNTGFINFYNWSMGNGYKEGLTLDRIDNDKDYSPENCRWVTEDVQANNKSSNNHITDSDGEYLTFALYERKHGLVKNKVSKANRYRTLNEIVYTVDHPELKMHQVGGHLIDKDGFQHLIPRINKE